MAVVNFMVGSCCRSKKVEGRYTTGLKRVCVGERRKRECELPSYGAKIVILAPTPFSTRSWCEAFSYPLTWIYCSKADWYGSCEKRETGADRCLLLACLLPKGVLIGPNNNSSNEFFSTALKKKTFNIRQKKKMKGAGRGCSSRETWSFLVQIWQKWTWKRTCSSPFFGPILGEY